MIIAIQTLIYFRESLLQVLDRLFRPYYKRLSLTFIRNGSVSDDDDDDCDDDQVFAEYDDEKGVIFFPPVYIQRYAAVSDCLMDERWGGDLEKVVDLGYNDMSFIKYLKDVPGIKHILGVDLEIIPLRCSSDLISYNEYVPKRDTSLQITLFQGNAADPDYRLIGCDAVVSIEMIEHMLPQDLERLVHTVFGFIKPRIAVFTTPNGDFNVLFKALEKNGLRRLDHFFEWSREQFHDWCSNIVERYPQYTVSCRGIGPGPSGTKHIGCCSQLALFVSKDYHKQPDLNPNSMMVVKNAPSLKALDDIPSDWDIVDSVENNVALMKNETDLDYSEMPSSTILTIFSTDSVPNLEYKDETSQCNLDREWGKNFMMYEDEQLYTVVKPSRKIKNKIYEIGDVASRLNCSTMEVKKFSKTTQNLIAKNKIDHLAHTREVVGEIKHLTKMLNFNKDGITQAGDTTWCNINWGENAPYWNQYYKVVREYNYPFEVKSEESRILDLISEEINRLLDSNHDGIICVDATKLEIPLENLMKTVRHITNDISRVIDILEWNGYEIVDSVLIFTRLVVDDASTSNYDDWQENDISEVKKCL